MSAIKSIGARLHRDKRGVPMVEYSILIGLITAAAVTLIAAQSPKIIAAWTTLDTAPR
jgi:pilus assembly protein Flp/PilA